MSVSQGDKHEIFITVVSTGTNVEVKPVNSLDLLTFCSNGTTNPSTSEYRLNGPVLVPADIN